MNQAMCWTVMGCTACILSTLAQTARAKPADAKPPNGPLVLAADTPWVVAPDEPDISTPQARGALITKAIAKQVELIRKAQPDATIISNLWVEGADLYLAGYPKLPAGVKVVWPDDSAGMIRDRGQVQAGQGIYYHTAMLNGQSNQLSEMANPARIIGEAYSELYKYQEPFAKNFPLMYPRQEK